MFNLSLGILPKAPLRSLSSYKSVLSLENLYPNSSTLKLTTQSQSSQTQTSKSGFDGYIPIEQLDVTYSKSSGPGGQNVNKVNTKVDIRFHVQSAKWLQPEIKEKLIQQLHNKMSNDGFLIFKSDLTRSQQLNVADCLQKIRECIRRVSVEPATPSEETMERVRRRIERATIERLRQKNVRSVIKEDRRSPNVAFD